MKFISAKVLFSTLLPFALFGGSLGCGQSSEAPSLQIERGVVLSEQGSPQDAIKLFDAALRQDANNSKGYYQRGLAHEQLGRVDQALEDYARAIEINPQYLEALNNRAVLFAKKQEFEKAIDELSQLIEIEPDFTLAYKNRGLALHDLDRFPEALEDYNKAIEMEADAQSFFLRGNLHLEMENRRAAIKDYDRAVDMDPNLANAWLNRGTAYLDLGETEKANKSLNQAALADPNLASIVAVLVRQVDEIDLSGAEEFLKQSNLQVSKNDDSLLPFRIQGEGLDSLVCLARGEPGNSGPSIVLTAEQAERLEQQTDSLSLLVEVEPAAGGERSWYFEKAWQPKKEDFQVSHVRISLPKQETRVSQKD